MYMLSYLEQLIAARRANPQEGSYTNQLMARGRAKIAQKVGEESVEVVVAALAEDKARQQEELADLLYHTLVLMNELGISLEDVNQVLLQRHQAK